MKNNKMLKICLVMALAVALVGTMMARNSVLKATDTGDADYSAQAPAAESVVQNITIPAATEAPVPTEAPAATEASAATQISAPTEAPAASEPAATEVTEPVVTEATEVTEPAATEATEAMEPAAAEATEVTELSVTEATEVTEPAAAEAAESICTCAAAEGQPHAAECPLYIEPEVTEPVCTCGAEECQPHAEECPLYVAPTCACGAADGQSHAAECPLYEEPVELDVTITVENLSGGEIAFGSIVRLNANVSNAPEGADLSYQWFYSLDGENWNAISGATAAHYDFTLNETNNCYYWQVAVTQ